MLRATLRVQVSSPDCRAYYALTRQSLVHKVQLAGKASRKGTELQQAAEIHTAAGVTAAARFVPFATLGHAELVQKIRDLAQPNKAP